MSNGLTVTEPKTNQKAKETSYSENNRGGKFLTFFLEEEEYGLQILKVHEIIGVMDITSVPRTPVFVKGVINLRGKIIPVIDLRRKFRMDTIDYTQQTCIIVVQVQETQMGIIVDQVSEVLDIQDEDIEDTPNFGKDVTTDYILGIGKSESKVKLLLDIEKVLSAQDVVDIQSVVESADIAEAESESNRSHPKKGVSKETKERRRDHVKRSQ